MPKKKSLKQKAKPPKKMAKPRGYMGVRGGNYKP